MNKPLDYSINDIIYLKDKNLLTHKNVDDIWTSRANYSQSFFNDNIANTLINFRRKQLLINEDPRFDTSGFKRIIPYKNMVYKSLIKKYNSLNSEEKNLLKNSLRFSDVGNPFYINYEGIKFNKRWIHNVHYTYLIKKYLSEDVLNQSTTIVDIGGGYGILGYMLNKINFKGTYVLVEFPEQLVAAQYFLRSSFPNHTISTLKFFYENDINENIIRNFNFFLCPYDKFKKLEKCSIDLVTNFFSFGEMSKKNFNNYFESNILKYTKYIFFINRFFSDIEYNNNISILDYKLNNFNKIYFELHKMESTYIKQYYKFFGKEQSFNSPFFEIIGKNEV
jgi:putative sugar O-methyltransferase